jgi:hypothetical protein
VGVVGQLHHTKYQLQKNLDIAALEEIPVIFVYRNSCLFMIYLTAFSVAQIVGYSIEWDDY